jgi:hypothetical protein
MLNQSQVKRRVTNFRRSRIRSLFFEQMEERLNLSVTFLEVEQNDSLATAQLVSHVDGGNVVDSMTPASNAAQLTNNDPDFYKFSARVVGELRVAVLNLGGDPDGDSSTADSTITVTLYSNSNGVISSATTGAGNTAAFATTAANTTDVFKVGIDGASAGNDADYQVRIWSVDANDVAFVGNTKASAIDLGTFNGTDLVSGSQTITRPDRDFYQFVAANAGPVTVTLNMPVDTGFRDGANGPTNLGVRVLNSSGQIIATSNSSQGNVDIANFQASAGGIYHVEVYSGSVGQVNAYDLSISAPQGHVSGFVYQDANANTFQDLSEAGLQNWRVYIDLNANGMFDSGTETAVSTLTDANGFYELDVPVGVNVVRQDPLTTSTFQTYPEASDLGQFVVSITESAILDHLDFGNASADFGDAPDPTFPTRLASDGARHLLGSGLTLGNTVDAEADGQPTAAADGDGADEDGVTFSGALVRGQNVTITLNASAAGIAQGWIDLNADGSWGAGEQVITDQAVIAGANYFVVAIPSGATVSQNVFSRFRLSTAAGLGVTGLAPDGEVEDYQTPIIEPANIEFVLNASTVAEDVGGGKHTVTLKLNLPTGSLASDVTVDVDDLLLGTASAGGIDYTLTDPTPITFPAGSVDGATKSFDIAIVDDSLAEVDETIKLQLTTIAGGGGQVMIGTNNTHQVTITDATDQAAVTVVFDSVSSAVAEANVGHNVGVRLVTTGGITLGAALTADVTDANTGTATSGTDYTAVGIKTVTFPIGSGNGAIQNATISILDDTLAESNEDLDLALGNVLGPGSLGPGIAHEVMITDNSDRGNVTVVFDQTSSSVAEANVGHPVGVRLVTTGGITLGAALTADVTDAGTGTATGGSDYTVVGTKTVTFPIGSGNGAIQNATIGILDDTLAENNEDLDLAMGNVLGPGSLGPGIAHEVMITDNSDRGNVTVVFDQTSSSVAEANVGHLVGVRLVTTGGITLGAALTADVTDANTGTATSGTDYTAVGIKTVTFPIGSGNGAIQNATIGILDDTLAESNEDLDLALGNVLGPGSLGPGIAHEVVITDNSDRGNVTVVFDQTSSSVAEANVGHPVEVRLVTTGGITLGAALTADVTDAGTGTATSGSDYTVVGTKTVTFPIGSGNGAIQNATIGILDDTLAENNEDLDLALGNVLGPGSLGPGIAHEVMITDNSDRGNVTVVFDQTSSSVAEANVGHPVGVRLVTTGGITLGAALTAGVTDAGTGTATSGSDYTVVGTKTVTFPIGSGNGAIQNATIGILDDTLAENNEDLDLALGNVLGPGSLGPGIAHEVTITDASDRGNVTVQFAAGSSNAPEAGGSHIVQVRLGLSGGITIDPGASVVATVTDATGGSATSGTDYNVFGSQTATFTSADGNGATQNVSLTVIDDPDIEGDETVNLAVAVTSGPAVVGAPTNHVVTIKDDDTPTVSITANDPNAGETATNNGQFTVSLSSGVAPVGGIDVSFSVTGTADGGADYAALVSPVRILQGNSSVTIDVVGIVDDNIVEGDETVIVTLTSTSNAQINVGTPDNATVTIQDNDATTVSITATDPTASETATDNGQFTVALAAGVAPTGGIQVNFTVGGTATPATDYQAIGSSVTILAGSSTATIDVTGIVEDTDIEGDETVIVTLTSTNNSAATIGTSDEDTVIILDNDFASIKGRKFLDANSGAALATQTSLGGWTIQLYEDDGDGQFEPENPFAGATVFVTAITKANPAVVTSNNHGFTTGDLIRFANVGGMTEVNDKTYRLTVINANSFSLSDPATGTPVNSTAFNIYTSGGTAELRGQDRFVASTVTAANGLYGFGPSLPNGTYFVREVEQSGWHQTRLEVDPGAIPVAGGAFKVVLSGANNPDTTHSYDFGNATCHLPNVADGAVTLGVGGTSPFNASWRNGILTISVSEGTFGITSGQTFQYFDAGTSALATSPVSATDLTRIDILINSTALQNAQFTITLSGSTGNAVVSVVNAVNVDTAGTLALRIEGSACGELIAVGDDNNDNGTERGDTSDAKAIYIGTVGGSIGSGSTLSATGVLYRTPIIDAMFGQPTISRVEINGNGGDDVIRVSSEITVQQSTLDGGEGNDNIHAGGGKSTIFGGNGHDLLIGGAADDVINGGNGDDVIFGGRGADRAFGGDGNDLIAGGEDNDPLLRGGNGNDRISGGPGQDRLLGDDGVDILYRDNNDLLVSGEIINTVTTVTPPTPTTDVVDRALLELLGRIWNDHFNSDGLDNDRDGLIDEGGEGDDDGLLDTLDELIKSLLPAPQPPLP